MRPRVVRAGSTTRTPVWWASVAGPVTAVVDIVVFVALGDLVVWVDDEQQSAAFRAGDLHRAEELGVAAGKCC